MNIHKDYGVVFETDFESRRDVKGDMRGAHRVSYFLQLQHPEHGNAWMSTEFDTFSENVEDYLVPTKVIKRRVHNFDYRASDGRVGFGLANAHIEFSPFNYAPSNDNRYDSHDHLFDSGNYGCMQVHLGNDVMWAYNAHNLNVKDIGIGNGFPNKDWTFSQNSRQYTLKRLKVYAVRLVNGPTEGGVDMRGVAHGDVLRWDARMRTWGVDAISFNADGPVDEPNFVIAVTGQSNSQGYGTSYSSSEPDDQPHERIFGFNSARDAWEIADLNTESLGAAWHRHPGWQLFAFHFAKRLVEAYPDIRPGIINLGVSGQPICRWAKFDSTHPWCAFNIQRAAAFKSLPGDVYDKHEHKMSRAFSKLSSKNAKVDVVCWHQGEADHDVELGYYRECVYQVIRQYRGTPWCDADTPFVVGCTTGGAYGTSGWEKQNKILRELNADADPRTKCVDGRDLPVNDDLIHFSSRGQRMLGTLYFKTFRNIT